MREHSLVAGGRKWFGSDFVEMQQEALQATAALVAPWAPCILSGCEITVDGGDIMSVTAGFAALLDSNSQVHIVRVPASTPEHVDYHPRWIQLSTQQASRLYDDNQSRVIYTDYTGSWSYTGQAPDLEIVGAPPIAPRVPDRMGALAVEQELLLNDSFPTGNTLVEVHVRKNMLTRMVHVRGKITVQNAQSINTVYHVVPVATLPAEYRPGWDVFFSCVRRISGGTAPSTALELMVPITGAYHATLGFGFSPTKPADPGITSYTAYFNTSWPMP